VSWLTDAADVRRLHSAASDLISVEYEDLYLTQAGTQ